VSTGFQLNQTIPSPARWPIDLSSDTCLLRSFNLLRKKWNEVPYTGQDRLKTPDLLSHSDADILGVWENAYSTTSTGDGFSVRGWYQLLYKDFFRGKKILDVGCGLAPDCVWFAERGAIVTFLDIVKTNVQFAERVCKLKGLTKVEFCYMEDLRSLATLRKDYDVIFCCGSFINAPLELARMEAQALLEHLSVGGRWIELGYPKSRWEREGRIPFDQWGEKTDGGAPWIEWHDMEKVLYMLAPAKFDPVLHLEFHNSDFNWFDLIRRFGFSSKEISRSEVPDKERATGLSVLGAEKVSAHSALADTMASDLQQQPALYPETNATQPSDLARAPELAVSHTQCGFDLIVDRADYISVLLSRDGIVEAPETDLVTRIVRPGDTCIDSGCQIGYYSCLLAQLVGPKGCVYAFDADPRACRSTRRNLSVNGLQSAEVIQAALGDRDGQVSFHLSTDDQTRFSSLSSIPTRKEVISAYSRRLDTFLNDRHIDSVRLLKLDVEGAEELVLRGLGRFLTAHAIDFILLKCFDEHLQIFNSSTEVVSAFMRSAGYTCWEYGTNNSVGWSRTLQARPRGDCNYLFASPAVTDTICVISLAPALNWAQAQRAVLKADMEKLQDDIDWLLRSIKGHEELTKQLAAEKRASEAETKLVFEALEEQKRASSTLEAEKLALEAVLKGVEGSASYRITAPLRKLRDRMFPDNTLRRRFYATCLQMCGSVLRAIHPKS
jgi:FkbM family methyltransferase